MRTSILVVVITALLGCSSQRGVASPESEAWELVSHSLVWEDHWYGGFYGKSCLQSIADKPVLVHVEIFDREQKIGESCRSGTPIRKNTRSFLAYVDGTNLVFGGTLNPIREAAIVAAGSAKTCAADEDDVRALIARLKRRPPITATMPALTGDRAREFPTGSPSVEVKAYVARSVDAFRKSVATKSAAVVPDTKSETPTVLGSLDAPDPLAVIGTRDGSRVWLLSLPNRALLVDDDFCGLVYSPERYSGRDEEARVRRLRGLGIVGKHLATHSSPIQ